MNVAYPHLHAARAVNLVGNVATDEPLDVRIGRLRARGPFHLHSLARIARQRVTAITAELEALPKYKRPRLAASYQARTRDRKLAPVKFVKRKRGKPEPVARGPFCSSTYIAMSATCHPDCVFGRTADGKSGGCYADSGPTKALMRRLDDAAVGLSPFHIIAHEVFLLRHAFGGRRIRQDGGRDGRHGRDLRLHASGDVRTTIGAYALADADRDWKRRGGGRVWLFTRYWLTIPREAFGEIAVVASVERVSDIELAQARGYDAALVVPTFPSDRAFRHSASTARIIPCPATTRGRTCIECRLCLSPMGDAAVAFELHGALAARARHRLPVLDP